MKVYRSKKQEQIILQTYDELLELWGCEYVERDIATDFGTTHVIEAGLDGAPPLVLFHGVGDDAALMWIFNAAELGRHFKLYAVDTLGGPGKSVPNQNYNESFDDIAWIDQIFAGLKLERAFVAGVSNGGFLSQYYTLKRSDKVIKAVSISSTVAAAAANETVDPKNAKKAKAAAMKNMMKIFLPEALFPTDKNVCKLIKKMCGKNYNVFTDNPVIMAHYKGLLRGFNTAAMRYHKVVAFTSQEVDSVRDKIFYLVGEDDPFEKLGGKERLLENRMNATFYPEAGHGLNHELSSQINEKIVEVLLGNRL